MPDPKRRSDVVRTPERRAEHKAIREWYQTHCPDTRAFAGVDPFPADVTLDGYVAGRQVVLLLAQHRAAAGLTLADVAARTGIDEATLGRLEEGAIGNPSIDLLVRYAIGVGKRLKWSV
jgi:DNA-binding XRE family transcriptional regulator